MIYLVHKQSKATLQVPKENPTRLFLEKLNRQFPHCFIVDWSQYLFYVKTNQEEHENRRYEDIKRTPKGFYWHSKYLNERTSRIHQINERKTCIECGEDIGSSRRRVYCCGQCAREHHSAVRKVAQPVELKQTHPGSMETLSGGE